jgi:hypothetical protein
MQSAEPGDSTGILQSQAVEVESHLLLSFLPDNPHNKSPMRHATAHLQTPAACIAHAMRNEVEGTLSGVLEAQGRQSRRS